MLRNFECHFACRYGQLLGLLKDPISATVWAYTEKAVFRYKVKYNDHFNDLFDDAVVVFFRNFGRIFGTAKRKSNSRDRICAFAPFLSGRFVLPFGSSKIQKAHRSRVCLERL